MADGVDPKPAEISVHSEQNPVLNGQLLNGFHINGDIGRDPCYEDFDSLDHCQQEPEPEVRREEPEAPARRTSGRIKEKRLQIEAAAAEELSSNGGSKVKVANGITQKKIQKKVGKSKSSPVIPDELHEDKPMKVKSRWRQSIEADSQLSMEPRVDLTLLKPEQLSKYGGSSETISSSSSPSSLDQELKQVKRDAVMKQEDVLNASDETKAEIKERLSSFEHIVENKFICERRFNKQNRGMECDCSLTKEEVRKGIKGCGEDCLNRLLMIECDKACSLGKLCGNKRFQNVENSPTEVFKTSWKGIGLRATADIEG